MAGDTFSKYQTVEMSPTDLETWKWFIANKLVFERIVELRRTKVGFYVNEKGEIDRYSLEITKKI